MWYFHLSCELLFILIVNNDIINRDVNTCSLETESIPEFTQLYLINNKHYMLFYTEKEAKLVAESRESANIIVIFKKNLLPLLFL